MNFRVIPIPILKDNYVWAIINAKKTEAIIVDPGDAGPIIAYLQQHQLALNAVFITHHHWDHTNGLADLIHQYNMPVIGFIHSIVKGLTHRVKEGDVLDKAFLSSQIIEIPGHTLDHIAYYFPGILFCGDTLFSGGCGR
jgi:hydroxyacylglutathione hydrolase